MSADQNLKDLNIQLPEAPKPVGAYAAYKKIGKLIYFTMIFNHQFILQILLKN